MKYCCKEFQETDEDLCGGSPFAHGGRDYIGMPDKNKWHIMWEIDMASSGSSYRPINYCPFCGSKLDEED